MVRDPFDDYARALAVLDAWRGRRETGTAETEAELLAQHQDLAEILTPMVAACLTDADTDPPDPASHEPEVVAAGDRLGPYRLLRLLGQGGMGSVFLAEHTELGRRVALKRILPERMYAPTARERFRREARAAAKLDHPGICAVYEAFEADHVPCLAMRYVEGVTLAERIARARADVRAPLPPAEVVRIGEQVARALHHAHEQGVIHRDVKPGNIMLTPEGTAVVLDFGLARDAEAEELLTMTGDQPGSPLYMSPEQIKPKGRVLDRRTDVYSLGVTLHECLTLEPRFRGSTLREIQDAILNGRATETALRAMPRDLQAVLEKATELNRSHRYSTALELAEELQRFDQRMPVLARRAGWGLRITRWTQRNPLPAAFMAVVSLGLVALLFQNRQLSQAAHAFDVLAQSTRLDEAIDRERQLYDNWPGHAAKLAEWREQYQGLLAYREPLDTVLGGLDDLRVTPEVSKYLKNGLEKLRADLGAFEEQQFALVAWLLDQVPGLTVGSDADWQSALATLAKDPRFAGLALERQKALVPLGPDPVSGLNEFGHPQSGALPQRDAVTGRWKITEDTGLVFVLVPGGSFAMGAQRENRAEPGFWDSALANEGPVNKVELEPFFISRYELTQGQWDRLVHRFKSNVATFSTGKTHHQETFTKAHPMEMVSWEDATEVLRWHGMELPTEAQWEYSCRAGTRDPWSTGPLPESLIGHANLADKRVWEALHFKSAEDWKNLDDGFVQHAPVDALLPNPWGLHHMHGNVGEWCQDLFDLYKRGDPKPGNGLREPQPKDRFYIVRGGNWHERADQARASYRKYDTTPNSGIGIRPAYRIR